MNIILDVGFELKHHSCRTFDGGVVICKWTFDIYGPMELLVQKVTKGGHFISKGNPEKPYEATLIKNLSNEYGETYEEIFTRGYLNQRDIERMIQDLKIKFMYGNAGGPMPAA